MGYKPPWEGTRGFVVQPAQIHTSITLHTPSNKGWFSAELQRSDLTSWLTSLAFPRGMLFSILCFCLDVSLAILNSFMGGRRDLQLWKKERWHFENKYKMQTSED